MKKKKVWVTPKVIAQGRRKAQAFLKRTIKEAANLGFRMSTVHHAKEIVSVTISYNSMDGFSKLYLNSMYGKFAAHQ